MDEGLYRVDLDSETAKDLAQTGATVLMLGVPAGSYIGVDHQAFCAGPKFKGVKMLPPGPHFFSCRPHNTESGGAAPPTGFFVHLKPRQVLVRVWDVTTEQLLDMADPDEVARYAEGVRRFDFDAFLAPYDLSSFRRWSGLSRHISADLIAELSPVGCSGNICIMAEAEDPDLLDPKTDAERDLVRQLQAGRARREEARQAAVTEDGTVEGSEGRRETGRQAASSTAFCSPPSTSLNGRCFYTRLPDRLVKKKGLTSAELTSINLDKTPALLAALSGRHGSEGSASTSINSGLDVILGELQFAFIAFVYGQSLDGFQQWKALLMLTLGCESAALHSHQMGFTELLRVLRMQLQAALGKADSAASREDAGDHLKGEAPFGLPMIEELLPDSFLRKMLGSFFHMLQENNGEVGAKMQQEAQALKQVLRTRLSWEYDIHVFGVDDDEDNEDLPVIVDASEPYAL